MVAIAGEKWTEKPFPSVPNVHGQAVLNGKDIRCKIE